MRTLFLLLIPLCLSVNAQVKEISFLGKKWYLHGYDFRIKGRDYGDDFYRQLSIQNTFPDEKYAQELSNAYQYKIRSLPKQINTLSAGIVFRPFYNSPLKFIKQFEFSHNVELERINTSAQATFTNSHGESQMLFRTFQIGYNPRFIISSPTFADHLKFYLSGDSYAFLPISGYVYNQIDETYLLNQTDGYNKNKIPFTDRLGTNHFKFGGGFSVGIKMNINCNWNFHMEASAFDIYTRHAATKLTTQSGNRGIQFGLRYKFGVPGESDSIPNNHAVFW